MIVYDPVPEDCIERVVCGEGDRILFERICTLRFVPKITLRSRCQAQQHQQQPQSVGVPMQAFGNMRKLMSQIEAEEKGENSGFQTCKHLETSAGR